MLAYSPPALIKSQIASTNKAKKKADFSRTTFGRLINLEKSAYPKQKRAVGKAVRGIASVNPFKDDRPRARKPIKKQKGVLDGFFDF